MSQVSLSETNPNETTGGAGCLCHPRGGDETRGPFFLFPQTSTDDNLSPHAVLCEHCVGECAALLVLEPDPVIDLDPEDVVEVPIYPAMPEPSRVVKI